MGMRRRRVWRFAMLALAVHFVLFVSIRTQERPTKPQRPLAGKFEKRRPLREQVLRRAIVAPHRQRALRRSVVVPQAFARVTAPRARAPSAPHLLQTQRHTASLLRTAFTPGYGVPSPGRLQSRQVAVEVAARDGVDLGLELLDAEALDTGRYRALVVRDPQDPRGLQGFVHLAAVSIRSAVHAAESSDRYLGQAAWLARGSAAAVDWRPGGSVRALDELAGELVVQTRLKATVDREVYLEDPGWMDTPFVLVTAVAEFIPTAGEIEHLGRYLVSGGFAYVEVVGHNSREAGFYGYLRDLSSLRGLVEEALMGQGLQRGRDWDIRPMPLSHPVFTSYHTIHALPRPYWLVSQATVVNGWLNYESNPERFGWLGQEPPHLEGIFVKGRLAGIYSQQNYRDLWARRIERALTGSDAGIANWYRQNVGTRMPAEPALRLGINIVVYALTQEGSLARQYVVRE